MNMLKIAFALIVRCTWLLLTVSSGGEIEEFR